MITIERIATMKDLREHREAWNRLSGALPHRRFEWIASWWQFFGESQELFVLGARDREGRICGYAPWFVDKRRILGPTIRFLGSGRACGDHLTLLRDPERASSQIVATAFADALVEQSDRWQHLELIGGDDGDDALEHLAGALESRSVNVHRRPGTACYALPLATSWDEYLKSRSKGTRRKLRRHVERFDSGDFNILQCSDRESLQKHWKTFVCLHNQRHVDRHASSCFSSRRFRDFLLTACLDLTDAGMAELLIMNYLGEPIAAELCFLNDDTTYLYQSGMSPDFSDLAPGISMLAYLVRASIERGASTLDMLRGEEEYKSRWRALPSATIEIRAANSNWHARLGQTAWLAGSTMKHWLRESNIPLFTRELS